MEFLFPVILLVLVGFMLLTARRQKKVQAQTQQMQDSLTIGDRVQTTSGVYGTVTGVDDGVVDLELATGYVTRWNRLAVREVVHEDDLAASYPGAPTSVAPSDDTEGGDDRPVALEKDSERER
ncbi:MAG: preprotein translocase subunit YajC [Williamsia herbipolensis]|uniref:Preprotein translocase subunit YajC n=1 Tax=Williamsia serinedens TaxID=391736 RepID=A0ABT1GVY7_9NOCA|nr:preprotein translocase subunit YajC [Williamsia serinedens]MBE7160256.1 preprotein translocase subunit YajC [Williamsia herbipolensis]MCP2159141.1 preprotein translocase subunit YajC [Williamsia serinedens]